LVDPHAGHSRFSCRFMTKRFANNNARLLPAS
jgi:hypothetical protein